MERRARCRICKELVTYKNPNDLGYHLILEHPGYSPIYFTSDERSRSPTSNYFSNEGSINLKKSNEISVKSSRAKKSEASSLKTSNSCPKASTLSNICETRSLSTRKARSDETLYTPRENKKSRTNFGDKLKSLLTLSSITWMTGCRETGGDKEGKEDNHGRMKLSKISESFRKTTENHAVNPCQPDHSGHSRTVYFKNAPNVYNCNSHQKTKRRSCTSLSEYSGRSSRSVQPSSSGGSVVVCCNKTCPKKTESHSHRSRSHSSDKDDRESVHVIKGCRNKAEIKVYNKTQGLECPRKCFGKNSSFFGHSPKSISQSHRINQSKSANRRESKLCKHCEDQKRKAPEQRTTCVSGSRAKVRRSTSSIKKRSRKPCAPCSSPPRQSPLCQRSREKAKVEEEESYIKLYETMVTSWSPANKKIKCPCCCKCMIPMLRKQRKKITKHSLAASLLLTCWPIVFLLPMSFTYQYKAFCACCNRPIGTYDKKTHSIKLCVP